MTTVRELFRQVRETYLDDYVGESTEMEWTTEDSGLLWSNQDLIRFGDDAIDEFCLRRPIVDSSTAAVCEIAVTLGLAPLVSFDSRIIRIRAATLQSRVDNDESPLVKVYQSNMMEDTNWSWRSETGDVEMYMEDMGERTIQLIGTLAANDTLLLTVERTVLDQIEWPLAPWAPSTVYEEDDICHPITHNDHTYKVTVAGTSDATEPAFPTDGTTVADNDITWEDQGLVGDYEIVGIDRFHQLALVDWMLHRAYLKRDYQTYNLKISDHHANLFTKKVGPRLSAREEASKRKMSNVRPRTRVHY